MASHGHSHSHGHAHSHGAPGAPPNLHAMMHQSADAAQAQAAKQQARLTELAARRRRVEAAAAAKAAEAAESKAWSSSYEMWDKWDALVGVQEEEESLRESTKRRRLPTACDHDRSAEREVYELPTEEKMAACRRFRAQGRTYFAEGQWGRAAERYQLMLVYYDYTFPDGEAEQAEMDELRQAALLNLAACHLKERHVDDVVNYTSQALRHDSKCVKALYRRAQAYRMADKFALARADILAARALAPKSADIRKEAELLALMLRGYRDRSKRVSRAMFSGKHADRIEVIDDAAPTGDAGELKEEEALMDGAVSGYKLRARSEGEEDELADEEADEGGEPAREDVEEKEEVEEERKSVECADIAEEKTHAARDVPPATALQVATLPASAWWMKLLLQALLPLARLIEPVVHSMVQRADAKRA